MTEALRMVQVGSLNVERFEQVLAADSYADVRDALLRARVELAGRRVWNVNSTSRGGGVAELLTFLLAYARGAGVDARWAVIRGTEEFFAVTKRLHHHLHGFNGDRGPLGTDQRTAYEAPLAVAGLELAQLLEPGDVVLLHDPQTAGLIPHLHGRGAPIVWRCHIGADHVNAQVRHGWEFLRPYVEQADAVVFSRETYVWEGLDPERVVVIAPTVDAFSPKNQELDPATVRSILATAGVVNDPEAARAVPPAFTRLDGTPGRVQGRVVAQETAPLRAADRYILQVSRWDALKDPEGVILGFSEHVARTTDAHLIYAGPEVLAVADDPEGAKVLEAAKALWRGLPAESRERVHLVQLPMEDADENAAVVNALQRGAALVLQKSLAEGFGLTVAEAMWKGRPVVASRVGGICDQVEDGVTGVLLDDPADLTAYGEAVCRLLDDPDRAARLGTAARERVRAQFLGTRSLLAYLALFERLLGVSRP